MSIRKGSTLIPSSHERTPELGKRINSWNKQGASLKIGFFILSLWDIEYISSKCNKLNLEGNSHFLMHNAQTHVTQRRQIDGKMSIYQI